MPTIKLSRISITPPAPKSDAQGLVAEKPAAVADQSVEIPAALVQRLYSAIDIVPGLTLETALTLALQQFLGSLPASYDD